MRILEIICRGKFVLCFGFWRCNVNSLVGVIRRDELMDIGGGIRVFSFVL